MFNNLAIISLNYNSFQEIQRQVGSLMNEGIPKQVFYIIDNNSEDKDILKKFCAEHKLNFIENLENKGYAHGNNKAIKIAMKEGKNIFLILNPDIEISKKTIQQLYDKLLKDRKLFIIGPRICDKTDRELIYSDGGILTPKRFWDHHKNYNRNINDVSVPLDLNTEIDYVVGSVLMFKEEVIERIGWLREDFFMYYEETEWCYRLKKYNDMKMGVLTTSIAYHQMSSKNNFYKYYTTRNRIWLFRLHKINYLLFIKKTVTKSFKDIFKRSKDTNIKERIFFFVLMVRAVISGCFKKI